MGAGRPGRLGKSGGGRQGTEGGGAVPHLHQRRPAPGEGAGEEKLGGGVLHLGADGPAEGPGAVVRVKARARPKASRAFVGDLEGHLPALQPGAEPVQEPLGDAPDLQPGELGERR